MKGMPKSTLCELLGISRQKYYRACWTEAKSKARATKVLDMVQQERQYQPRVGVRKLYFMLKPRLRELHIGRDMLFSIMRANHMLVEPIRSYHTTTNSHHRFRKHKNLIADMEITRPEQVWVSDITYIGHRNNHMYLALITDAYSKKIMGYDLSSSLGTAGSVRALKMANSNRAYPGLPLIHHSDRGIQYCSDIYQKRLRRYGITTSMTESYDPYANAVAERVNGILKQEFALEDYNYPIQIMRKIVADAICTYNQRRPHFSCELLTPEMMHRQDKIKIKVYKKSHQRGTPLMRHDNVLTLSN